MFKLCRRLVLNTSFAVRAVESREACARTIAVVPVVAGTGRDTVRCERGTTDHFHLIGVTVALVLARGSVEPGLTLAVAVGIHAI